jgi:hypothetical protein
MENRNRDLPACSIVLCFNLFSYYKALGSSTTPLAPTLLPINFTSFLKVFLASACDMFYILDLVINDGHVDPRIFKVRELFKVFFYKKIALFIKWTFCFAELLLLYAFKQIMTLRIFVNISVNVPSYVRASFCNNGDRFPHFSNKGDPEGSLFLQISEFYISSCAENLWVVLNTIVFSDNSVFPPVTKNNILPLKRTIFSHKSIFPPMIKTCCFLPNIPAAPGPISLRPFVDLSDHFPCKLPIKPNQFLILHTPVLKMEAVCYFEISASAYKSRRCHNNKITGWICVIIVYLLIIQK